jgi:hypothetical protein
MKDAHLNLVAAARSPVVIQQRIVVLPDRPADSAAPMMPSLPHLDAAEGSSAVGRLRNGTLRFGRGLLFGEPMVPIFEFVRRLRALMGHQWPDISDEAACAIIKQNLYEWTGSLHLRVPNVPCHVMIGWILPHEDEAKATEIYLG